MWLLFVRADDALLARATAHDGVDDLVTVLFRQEGASLVRLARIFTDDRNAAEDLVQEAFIRLQRSAYRIRDPEAAPAYLRSIVLNLARDHNRRGLMSLRHLEALTLESAPGVALEDLIVRDDEQARMLAALNELSPRQRVCLTLRFYMDMSESEIARTMSISPNSVKTHCRRGMEALAARLGDTR